ncbi:CHAP domain protein [compost metagenome]
MKCIGRRVLHGCFVAIALLSTITTQPVLATDIGEGAYAGNNIDFHGKSTAICSATSTSTDTGQASSKDIVNAAAKGAEKYRQNYESVGKAKDVPWQLLAAIHYRETAYGDINPANGQGLFQFVAEAGKYPAGQVSPENFTEQLNYLADKLKTDYATRPGDPALASATLTATGTDPNKIKDIAFSYNGRAGIYAQQARNLGFSMDADGSPYVMNFFDDKRDPQKAAPNTWGQVKRDFGSIEYPANNQVGLFTLYVALGGGSASSSSCDGGASGGTIIEIAKRELDKGTKGCMVTTAGQCGIYTDNHTEAWCADFVSWVYKEAGTPFTGGESGGWRIPGVFGLDDYLSSKQVHFLKDDTSQTPKPGDVIIFNETGPRSHTGLVYTVEGEKITTIEGNINDSVITREFNNYRSNPSIHAFGRMK